MPAETVKLISAEGFEFIVDKKAACVSNTIKQMLSSEGQTFHCFLPHLAPAAYSSKQPSASDKGDPATKQE